jgi:hypothetical protein
MAALTAIEEITHIIDYKESMLMHLEELPLVAPNDKNVPCPFLAYSGHSPSGPSGAQLQAPFVKFLQQYWLGDHPGFHIGRRAQGERWRLMAYSTTSSALLRQT